MAVSLKIKAHKRSVALNISTKTFKTASDELPKTMALSLKSTTLCKSFWILRILIQNNLSWMIGDWKFIHV